MKDSTLFCNLFAGPSSGKSTSASLIFGNLKLHGINAELVQEYAKDKVWGEDMKPLKYQTAILGKQIYRQFRLVDQVDVAVTDSPILFSTIYRGLDYVEGFNEVVVKQFNLFRNLNIFLVRNPEEHPYNPKGRTQSEEQAMEKDAEILEMLIKYDIPFHTIEVKKDGSHIQKILNLIYSEINFQSLHNQNTI